MDTLRFDARRSYSALTLDLSLAVRNVLRQRRRSAVGLGAVAAGVVALLLASGFFEWNYDAMRERTIRARIGHVQVMRSGYAEAGSADPFRYLMPVQGPAVQQLQALSQMETVAPRLAFNGLISVGESTVSFLGEGVDPQRERLLSGAMVIVAGEDLADDDVNGIIVGQGLARSLGLRPGQTVVLLANTATRGLGAVEVHVRGIFATVTKAYDDYAIRVPLPTAQRLLRVSGIHMWLVLLKRTADTDGVVEQLRASPAFAGLDVTAWHETPTADFYRKTVSLFSKQVLVVKLMIAIIIVLSIANTMATNVRERTAEIGTCMALGDRRRTVLRRFLAEGAVLGLFGGLLGAIAGIALARLITWVGIPMPPAPGMATNYVAGIVVTPGLVFEALALSVVTSFIAGVLPAWRASRMIIHDALRYAR